jgi:pyruvate formate lyase activating enzyme
MKPTITRREFIKEAVIKGTALAVASKTIPVISQASASENLKEAMFYKPVDGVKIQCMLEPRQCIVNDWERGYCGAKENRGGKYYSLVYSKPCAVYTEPIERDHFYHVLPGNQFLGIGTAGCNLGCKFCETWRISQVRPEETKNQNLSPEDAVQMAINKGCKIITFTYNEPVICYEFTLETAKAAKKAGLITLCHSAGYIYKEPLITLLEHIDAINVDLKGFSEKYYQEMCGIELGQILNTLKTIKQQNVMLEITNLLVTEKNDSREDINSLTRWVAENLGKDTPLHFARFFPNYQLTNLLATPLETLDMAYEIARFNGLEFVYVGNAPEYKYQSTFCPSCKKELINRNELEVSIPGLDEKGICKNCGHVIPGIWSVNRNQ